jgi:hypothetical protein
VCLELLSSALSTLASFPSVSINERRQESECRSERKSKEAFPDTSPPSVGFRHPPCIFCAYNAEKS